MNHQQISHGFLQDVDSVKRFIVDIFRSVTERDIYTGDGGCIVTLSAGAETLDSFNLRKD